MPSYWLHGRFDLETRGSGWDRDLAFANVQCRCSLAECAINHEIAGRKAFWVDGALAELLAQTSLEPVNAKLHGTLVGRRPQRDVGSQPRKWRAGPRK